MNEKRKQLVRDFLEMCGDDRKEDLTPLIESWGSNDYSKELAKEQPWKEYYLYNPVPVYWSRHQRPKRFQYELSDFL